jgi:hypothetical protein
LLSRLAAPVRLKAGPITAIAYAKIIHGLRMHVSFSRGTRHFRGAVSVRHRICSFLMFAVCANAAVLRVGPGQQYLTPCDAIHAAAAGDTIQIDAAGNYDGDVCGWTTNDLTIVGGNGRPRIDAAGESFRGRATWMISGNNTTVENIEFTGAKGPDQNGAAIWQLGANLTIRKCYIHGNEDGILAGDNPTSHIVIENTEFAENGYGDGQSHNIYINHIARFTLRFSYSHDAISGHLVKSRAVENFILYNRLTGESGTSSLELDLPNGGLSYVIGNVIQQGPFTENSTIVAYGEEGATNPDSTLYFVNNTVVNNRWNGFFIKIGAGILMHIGIAVVYPIPVFGWIVVSIYAGLLPERCYRPVECFIRTSTPGKPGTLSLSPRMIGGIVIVYALSIAAFYAPGYLPIKAVRKAAWLSAGIASHEVFAEGAFSRYDYQLRLVPGGTAWQFRTREATC